MINISHESLILNQSETKRCKKKTKPFDVRSIDVFRHTYSNNNSNDLFANKATACDFAKLFYEDKCVCEPLTIGFEKQNKSIAITAHRIA